MITIEEINAAIKDVKPLFSELQNLYGGLPQTRCQCQQPGVCCAFLPEMTLLEALQWAGLMQDMAADARLAILQKFLEFYLTNPIRPVGCPFLENGACGIYEVRPFACRAYGLWSQELGKTKTQKSRQERNALLRMWQNFGLELPAHTVGIEIDYCDRVGCTAEQSMSDRRLMNILQQIYGLDQALPDLQAKLEDEYHSDFSFLIASLSLGYRKAVLGKFAVVKEIVQQGTDERLQQMLGKISPGVLGET